MKIIRLLVTEHSGEATSFEVGKPFPKDKGTIVTEIKCTVVYGVQSYTVYFKNGKIFNLDGYQFLSEVVNDD